MSKDTTIRVKTYTKERIIKASKRLNITQGEVVERALLTAEKFNFSTDDYVVQIKKIVQKESNRLIGFLKVQDKNLLQVQKNLEYKISGVPKEKTQREIKEQNGLQFYTFINTQIDETIEGITNEIDELRLTNGKLDPTKAEGNFEQIKRYNAERKEMEEIKGRMEDYWTEYLYKD